MSEPKIVNSNITSVVVFMDGARVTRSGKEKLTAGINELKLEKISKYLDKDSIRVKGSGKNIKAKLVDVQSNHNYKEISGHEGIDKLRKQIKDLNTEIKDLTERKDSLTNRKGFIFQIFDNFSKEFPKFFAAGESKIENLKSLQAYSEEMEIDIQQKIKEIDDKIEKLTIKIQELKKELGKLGGQITKIEENYDVSISIESDGEGDFEFTVTYQIANARWIPFYDVNITEEQTTIDYSANVINKTLEDWEEIELEISTATFKPIRINNPNPWYISEYQPYDGFGGGRMMKKKEKRRAPSAAPMKPKVMDMLAAGIAEDKPMELEEKEIITEMEVDEAEFAETPYGVQRFKIPKKMSMKSDENKHPVMLQSFEAKSSRLFYWNSVDQQVIAQEKIKNGELTLLPGKAKCYVDGDFVGETNIKVISPSEEFKIGTRLSYEMKIEKKLKERDVDKKGITKGKRENEYSYEIKINNYRKEESSITIVDRLPHSTSADIEVEPQKKHVEEYIIPKPKKYELGIATWELKLQAEEEFKIKYKFSVKYGKDITVTPSLP